jgi:hypothetical protein
MKHNKLRSLNSGADFRDELEDLSIAIPGDVDLDNYAARADELRDATGDLKDRVKVVTDSYQRARKTDMPEDVCKILDLTILKGLDPAKKPDVKVSVEIFQRELDAAAVQFRGYLGLKRGEKLPNTLTEAQKTAFDHYMAKHGKVSLLEPKEDLYWGDLTTELSRISGSMDKRTGQPIVDLAHTITLLRTELFAQRAEYYRTADTHRHLKGHTSKQVMDLVGDHLRHADTTRKKHEEGGKDVAKHEKRHVAIEHGDAKFADELAKVQLGMKGMLEVMNARGSTVDADAINMRVDALTISRKGETEELRKRRLSVIAGKRAQNNKDLASAYGLLFNYGSVQKSASVNKLYEHLKVNVSMFRDYSVELHACLAAKCYSKDGDCSTQWNVLATKVTERYRSDAAFREALENNADYDEGRERQMKKRLDTARKLFDEIMPAEATLLPVSYVAISALIGKNIDPLSDAKLKEKSDAGLYQEAEPVLSAVLGSSAPCTAEIRFGDSTVELLTVEADALASGAMFPLPARLADKCLQHGVYGLKIREVKAVAQLLDDMDETMALELKPVEARDGTPVPNAVKAIARGRKDANIDIVYLDAKNKVVKVDANINTDIEDGPEMKFVLAHIDINADLLRVTDKPSMWGKKHATVETSALAA